MAAPKPYPGYIVPTDYAPKDERYGTTHMSPFYYSQSINNPIDPFWYPSLPSAINSKITAEARRQRRLAALQAAEGLWKDRTDLHDGVEYQELLRAEWR